MAVYTHVPAEEMAAFLTRYNAGELVSAKGIAEGVENSNYLVETKQDRFILTLYEKRVDEADLPFFMDLLDHLGARGFKEIGSASWRERVWELVLVVVVHLTFK